MELPTNPTNWLNIFVMLEMQGSGYVVGVEAG
jgi:hypothetical protein